MKYLQVLHVYIATHLMFSELVANQTTSYHTEHCVGNKCLCHTHTHAHTHARMHARTNTHTCTHTINSIHPILENQS